MDPDFDLLTIGAGSGGVAASRRAALHGARVAVVEDSRVGGTCVMRGCVPKKLLMYAGQIGETLREAPGYGWQTGEAAFEMGPWAEAKTRELARLEQIYRDMLAKSGVELIEGRARLDGPGQVVVETAQGRRRLNARHVLIATGSSPVQDRLPGLELCATSDDLLELRRLPARAAVLGAGYIAVEFASMLARLGVEVELFFRGELPLRGFDIDLRRQLARALEAAGVTLRARHFPASVTREGATSFRLQFEDGSSSLAPWVLNATGRRPNTDGLGLDSVGLQPGEDGAVPVDDAGQTPVPGLHAIGDVTNRRNLTPVAIAEGRALADRLFGGLDHVPDFSRVASAVFTLPPLASVGPDEDELAARAEREGWQLKVYATDFRPMRSAFVGGSERSYMKLLVDGRTDRVLAVHMLGADAPEIVQSLAVALSAGATKAHFDRTIAVHPTAAEEFVLMREVSRVRPAAPG